MSEIEEIAVTEMNDSGRVLDNDVNEWVKGWQNVFRIQKTVVFADNKIFDSTNQTYISSSFRCDKYSQFDLQLDRQQTGSAGSIIIYFEFSDDNNLFYIPRYPNDFEFLFGYDLTRTKNSYFGRVNSQYCRVRAVPSAVTDTITLTMKCNFSNLG